MTFDPKIDYYAVLQVHQNAHQEVVKRAYHTIVVLLQAHPDLGGSHEDAVLVNEAYQVLSDPVTRRAYDAARWRLAHQPSEPPREQAHVASAATAPAFAEGHAHGAAATSTLTRSRHTVSSAKQTVYCPWCGARNRLSAHKSLRNTYCGKCRAPLDTERTTPREYTPQVASIRLSAQQQEAMFTRGELRLERALPPVDGRLHCMRCQFEWLDTGRAQQLPERCPHCHSARWSHFRVFACRHCQHQFCTANLHTWPYWLFPECPACHKTRWHAECEQHPLRWVVNQLLGW